MPFFSFLVYTILILINSIIMKHYTGSDLGQDFRTFFSKERSRIKKALESKGCTDIQMSRQFYFYYGFFTDPKGQIYYFSIDDVRHFINDRRHLYRTAKSYTDYKGGSNQYIDDITKLNFI